jgi:DNA-binding SARP family transcriptional activator
MTPHPSRQSPAEPLAPPAALSARLLGPVHLAVNGRSLPDEIWRRRGARALFLLLLTTPGHRLARERAVDLLWPDHAPDRVRATWYQTLATLRRVLEPDLLARQASAFLTVDATMIALNPPAVRWIDIDAFEMTLRRAGSGSPDEQRAHLRAALALYGGDLLTEEPEVDWVTGRREELRRAKHRAAIQLAALERQAGEPLATVAAL